MTGRRPAPRAHARLLAGRRARGVRAAAPCSLEGACPFAPSWVPEGLRPQVSGIAWL